jgi:toxin FitB
MKWVVDTNVISELKRPSPNAAILEWYGSVSMESIYTTVVNISEIRAGITALQSVAHAAELSTWLATVIRPFYQGRILEANEGAFVRWHQIRQLMQARQLPNPPVDTLIAAIAIENNACVVTRDVKGFVATGVPLLNPFTGERFNGA